MAANKIIVYNCNGVLVGRVENEIAKNNEFDNVVKSFSWF